MTLGSAGRNGRESPLRRADFRRFHPVQTRWGDNDVYGHVNNVVYYAYFDTAVNALLIEAGALEVKTSAIVGLVAETRCVYFAPVAFPDALEVGVGVSHVGRASVRYRLGLFRVGAADVSAQAEFVHVYVERATWRPMEMPPTVRALAETLRIG